MCLIQSLRSFIRGHAIRLLHQHGPWQFLSEGVLYYAGSAAHHSSQFSFCSSTAPSAMVLAYQHLGSLGISHSPFIYFAFVSAYISCVDFGFQSVISRRAMAFTTAPFTCWLRHQVHIRGSFAIPHFFGCRLVRAVFGYAEIVFSAVGLSELFAHLLAVLFTASMASAKIITPQRSFASHSLPPFLREQLRLIKFLGENLSPICHLVALGSIELRWQ